MASETANQTPALNARRKTKPLWKRPVPLVIGGLLLVFIIGGLMPKPIEVEVEAVVRGPLEVSVLEEGKTRVRERYVVAMPVNGLLQRVDLEPGDRVEAGKTILATVVPQISDFLDPRSRAQAEARVQAAEAAVRQREAELERVESSSKLARKELERGEALRKTGAIAAREFDALENQADVQQRALKAAEFGLRIARFELEQSRAALTPPSTTAEGGAPEPLKIIAPVSGSVLNRFEESARPLTAGTPVLEVGDPSEIEVEIELLSQDAVGVKPGADVRIEQWGGDGVLAGRVRVVEPAAFTKVSALGVEEQRVRVIADFVGDKQGWARLGDRYRVEARVVTWAGENVLHIPTGALFRRGERWMTFRYAAGTAKLVPVQIDHNSGLMAEVLSGVEQGDKVIVHPPDTVSDGAKVKPRSDSPAPH